MARRLRTSCSATSAPPVRPEFRPKQILSTLLEHVVEFVINVGLAGIAQGSVLPSYDVDIVYARDRSNIERLAEVLRVLQARLRGAPVDDSFLLDNVIVIRCALYLFN